MPAVLRTKKVASYTTRTLQTEGLQLQTGDTFSCHTVRLTPKHSKMHFSVELFCNQPTLDMTLGNYGWVKHDIESFHVSDSRVAVGKSAFNPLDVSFRLGHNGHIIFLLPRVSIEPITIFKLLFCMSLAISFFYF